MEKLFLEYATLEQLVTIFGGHIENKDGKKTYHSPARSNIPDHAKYFRKEVSVSGQGISVYCKENLQIKAFQNIVFKIVSDNVNEWGVFTMEALRKLSEVGIQCLDKFNLEDIQQGKVSAEIFNEAFSDQSKAE